MFDSEDKALAFRDDIVAELDGIETDGFVVSARLDGATVTLGTGTALVRGHLDGQGYRVRDRTTDEIESDGWESKIMVLPS